jgi:hypothetical protein
MQPAFRHSAGEFHSPAAALKKDPGEDETGLEAFDPCEIILTTAAKLPKPACLHHQPHQQKPRLLISNP